MFRRNRAQSVAEYAILISLVVAAAVAMQLYVKRGLQAKVKSGTDAFTNVNGTIDPGVGGTARLGTQSQYEPYYQESSYDRYQENVQRETMGGGKVVVNKVSDVTASAAGGFDRQINATNRGDRDAGWNNPE